MPIDAETFADFSALVSTDEEQTELKCAKYLHYAAELLVPATPVQIHIGAEDRNYFGSTDFIVSATLLNDQNLQERYAYIWELKSPQTYLFEFDDNQNRCRPTKEFVKAENQLIHYAYQAGGDQHFRERFEIMNHLNVRVGGLIIGRSADRMLKGGSTEEDVRKARTALSIRQNMLHISQSIRVLTWDRVLEFLAV